MTNKILTAPKQSEHDQGARARADPGWSAAIGCRRSWASAAGLAICSARSVSRRPPELRTAAATQGRRPAEPSKGILRNSCSVKEGRAAVRACRGHPGRHSARWRATAARPPCPVRTGQNGLGAAGPMKIGIEGAPATRGAARRSFRPGFFQAWWAGWPPTRTATGPRTSTTRRDAIAARPSTDRVRRAVPPPPQPVGAILATNPNASSYGRSG